MIRQTGHADGTYSHWNGYKIDISVNTCINNYVTSSFTFIGNRPGDGAAQYESGKLPSYIICLIQVSCKIWEGTQYSSLLLSFYKQLPETSMPRKAIIGISHIIKFS